VLTAYVLLSSAYQAPVTRGSREASLRSVADCETSRIEDSDADAISRHSKLADATPSRSLAISAVLAAAAPTRSLDRLDEPPSAAGRASAAVRRCNDCGVDLLGKVTSTLTGWCSCRCDGGGDDDDEGKSDGKNTSRSSPNARRSVAGDGVSPPRPAPPAAPNDDDRDLACSTSIHLTRDGVCGKHRVNSKARSFRPTTERCAQGCAHGCAFLWVP